MATQHIYVAGKIKWAKGLAELDKEYNSYSALLEVAREERDRLEVAGCQAKFKPAEGGLYGFKVKSSGSRSWIDKATGEKRTADTSPPEVFLISPEGKQVDVEPKTVGNGSDVTVKLELYDTNKGGKGTRLLAVRVDNYIEYVPQEATVIGGGPEPF